MTDKLSEYGFGFQVKVIAALFTDRIFLQQIADIIQPDYFESDSNSWLLEVILDHFREYKTPPSKDVLKVKVTEIENDILKTAVLEQLKEVFRYMESDDLSFVKDEILKFCKNQEIKRAIMDSVTLLKMGNYDEIKSKMDSAMKAGADTNIGLDYINDVASRYNEAARHTITTGWDVIDDLMDGGLAPGELGVVMAPAGIGKSWMLINIGANAIRAGHTVVHYTLELNENYVGQRYDSVLTGINAQTLKHHQDTVQEKMNALQGDLIVKYFPTKSVGVMGLKAHLEKTMMLGKKPALIIVDYGDLLKINSIIFNYFTDKNFKAAGGTQAFADSNFEYTYADKGEARDEFASRISVAYSSSIDKQNIKDSIKDMADGYTIDDAMMEKLIKEGLSLHKTRDLITNAKLLANIAKVLERYDDNEKDKHLWKL